MTTPPEFFSRTNQSGWESSRCSALTSLLDGTVLILSVFHISFQHLFRNGRGSPASGILRFLIRERCCRYYELSPNYPESFSRRNHANWSSSKLASSPRRGHLFKVWKRRESEYLIRQQWFDFCKISFSFLLMRNATRTEMWRMI